MRKSKKRFNNTPIGEIRQSQLLTTYGPGAMVDLPEQSVVISGLTYWKGDRQYIREDRLRNKICDILKKTDSNITEIKLFKPPHETNEFHAAQSGVKAFIFPMWFVKQVEQTIRLDGKDYRTRPLVNYRAVQEEKLKAVPVRFVQACVNGHLSDIDWYAYAHNDFKTKCRKQLWLDEGGSGNDFEEIFVRCECGKRRPLSQAKTPNSKVLGICQGHRPWLASNGKEECWACAIDNSGNIVQTDKPEYNRLLVRSASNAYFTQTLSVISIPDADAQLKKVVDRYYEEDLQFAEDIDEIKKELRKPKFADLKPFGAETVWAEIQRRKNGEPNLSKSIKQVEVEALLASPEEMTEVTANNDFHASTRKLNRNNFHPALLPYIDKVVLVHRLREVTALIGFTRFEAAMPNIEGEIDELAINVRRADLDFTTTWVPAIETKGEGVFISFSQQAIEAWLQKEAVKRRAKNLEHGFNKWLGSKGIPRDKAVFPGAPYIMLHSLSHLLITSVSLECGYAASAIRERIYASPSGYGILLYTGTSGSEGTLGGLVQIGKQIDRHLEKALASSRLCSNDPVCAQHEPYDSREARFLHGCACHGCLLIAETSCERRNEFLDRALVVNTVETADAAFFPDEL